MVGTFIPNDLLPLLMKCVLRSENSQMLDLNKWCQILGVVPMEVPECKHIFHRMLVSCKITKFHTVNYKILAYILATLKIIAGIRKEDNLRWCVWCSDVASLEHVLLDCPETKKIHVYIQRYLVLPHTLSRHSWIFGKNQASLNPIIWVTNFVLYKAPLIHVMVLR